MKIAIITDTHYGAKKGSKYLHDYFELFYIPGIPSSCIHKNSKLQKLKVCRNNSCEDDRSIRLLKTNAVDCKKIKIPWIKIDKNSVDN